MVLVFFYKKLRLVKQIGEIVKQILVGMLEIFSKERIDLSYVTTGATRSYLLKIKFAQRNGVATEIILSSFYM